MMDLLDFDALEAAGWLVVFAAILWLPCMAWWFS